MNMIPLGVCEIDFTLDGGSLVSLKTRKDQDCIFTSGYETNGIEYHQLPGVQKGFHYISEAPTLTCSVDLDLDVLEQLGSAYVAGTTGVGFNAHGAEVKFGEINIHPVSAGTATTYDIKGKRVYCTITSTMEFSDEGKTRADLVFTFSGNPDETDADYGMPFTVGSYS